MERNPSYWTAQEFAAAFDFNKKTVYRALNRGDIAGAFKVSGSWRILKSAFYASLKAEEDNGSEQG